MPVQVFPCQLVSVNCRRNGAQVTFSVTFYSQASWNDFQDRATAAHSLFANKGVSMQAGKRGQKGLVETEPRCLLEVGRLRWLTQDLRFSIVPLLKKCAKGALSNSPKKRRPQGPPFL